MTEDQYLGNLYQRFPVTIEKGQGSHVWDINNKEYIDCMGGYGVALVGHRNERVVNAIKAQIGRILTVHSSFYNKTREEHNLHHKRLLGLKTNQRLLKRQGDLLREAIRPERLEGHLEVVRKNLTGSWTTIGINQAITNFFASIDEDLQHLADEAEMANAMVAAIYRRHNEENPLHCVDAPQFNINRHLRDLKQLREQADQFRLQLKTLLTEQGVLARRFFATLAQEVIGLHQRLRQDAEQWANDALMPLMQHTLEHKQLLETHMLKLKSLAQETQLNRQRSEQLSRYHGELLVQLSQANGMLKVFRRPAPVQRQKKVVNLLASLRTEGARD